MNEIALVFKKELPKLVANRQLAELLRRFRIAFANKNSDHIEFFGGNLIGVHVIRFSDKDFSTFFNDILHVDYDALSAELKTVKGINANWKIASDVFNLTCIYLIHLFLTSKELDKKQREEAALNIGILFNYRCISALLNYYFRYPIDKKVAEAVYSVLSKHFLLKDLGTWQKFMEFRANAMVGKDSIHRKALELFDDDMALVNVMNDSQGRVRDTVKNMYKYFITVHQTGQRVGTQTSIVIGTDGDAVIKDRVNGLNIYSSYICSVVTDKTSFIKKDLLDVIEDVIYTVQPKQLLQTLEWLSDHYYSHEHETFVESLIKKVMVHSYQYLLSHRYILANKKDITGLLLKLRGIYTSSRSNDMTLIELRDLGNKMVQLALGDITLQAAASVRTSVFLYISLRAYTKQYYTGRN